MSMRDLSFPSRALFRLVTARKEEEEKKEEMRRSKRKESECMEKTDFRWVQKLRAAA